MDWLSLIGNMVFSNMQHIRSIPHNDRTMGYGVLAKPDLKRSQLVTSQELPKCQAHKGQTKGQDLGWGETKETGKHL